jgi:hypothetical protein
VDYLSNEHYRGDLHWLGSECTYISSQRPTYFNPTSIKLVGLHSLLQYIILYFVFKGKWIVVGHDKTSRRRLQNKIIQISR